MNATESFLDVLRGRRSIRRFQAQAVPKETLLQLLAAASWAPSAGNRQDWSFVVVTSPTAKEAMAAAVRERWRTIVEDNRDLSFMEDLERYAARFDDFARAPAVIVVAARRVHGLQRRMFGEPALATVGAFASAAMAAQNLMLAAHALGLASCCMTGPLAASETLARLLDLGRKEEIVCLVAAGWPDEAAAPPPRRPLAEIVRFMP